MASGSNSNSAATFTLSQTSVPIFDGDAYDFWSIQMRTIFISQGLWELVQSGYEQPDDAAALAAWDGDRKKQYNDNVMKDAKALMYIQQGVSKVIFPRIMGATMSKDAWEILKNEFKGSDKVITIKLQSLWKEFDNLLMKETESVKVFFSRVSNIINQMRSFGDSIEDKKIIEKILRSLPVKYDHVVAAIEESKDLSQLTLVELIGSLEAHECRMSRFTNQPIEQAFQTKLSFGDKEKKNYEGYGQKFQRSGSNYRGRGRGKPHDQGRKINQQGKSSFYCNLCRKNGHHTNDCRYKCTRCSRPNHFDKDCWFRQKQKANFSESGEASDELFFSRLKTQETSDIWYIDSGCSNHMTGGRNFFVNLNENLRSQVTLKDRKGHNVEGKGVVDVQTKEGTSKLINDVLFVPDLIQIC